MRRFYVIIWDIDGTNPDLCSGRLRGETGGL
jgi:hypothetical protein